MHFSFVASAVALGEAVAALTLAGAATLPDISAELKSDSILRAMTDELARWKGLGVADLAKPYFVQYASGDTHFFRATATLGALTSASSDNADVPTLRVRVGSYALDNTNTTFSQQPPIDTLPEDGDYTVTRYRLWLSTDALYKAAADEFAYKRSLNGAATTPDKTPDFAPAAAVHLLQPIGRDYGDEKAWTDEVRRLSRIFAHYGNVMDSQVYLRFITSTFRLVNTEGTAVRIPQTLRDVVITSSTFAADGSRVWNHRLVTGLENTDMPDEKSLAKIVESTAEETEALARATPAEDYTGPVLFEGEAAAQMMAQVLADTVRLQRKPLTPPGQAGGQMLESVWSSRLGSRVLPDWMSLVDDPLTDKTNGARLAGQYDVDDEGVRAQRVVLVDKGVLKQFLLSREPVHNFNQSNGHGRLPGPFGSHVPALSNLFVKAQNGVSEEALRKDFLNRLTKAGLPFGYIIRRLDFPSTASRDDLQDMARQMQKSGFARTLSAPILAYRVRSDGHEELVRGLRLREFSAKDLRDIAAASNESHVFNYVNSGGSFNHLDLAGDEVTSSVVCPSLLLESLDLAKAEGEGGRLPLVPSPPLSRP